MDPSPRVKMFPDITGGMEELVRYGEKYRHDMLMEAKHLLDRVNKLIILCGHYNEFLDEHMIARVRKTKKSKRLEEQKMTNLLHDKHVLKKKYKKMKRLYLKYKTRCLKRKKS